MRLRSKVQGSGLAAGGQFITLKVRDHAVPIAIKKRYLSGIKKAKLQRCLLSQR